VRGAGEEYCQAVVPGQAVFARVYREELQNGLTLVRENSKPVGSVSIIYTIVLEIIEQRFEDLTLSSSPFAPY
jgi:hypothetical protein